MDDISLPFDPLIDHLYRREELFAGFSANDPDSYARCPDIAILSYFFRHGKNPSSDGRVSTLQALHDNSISEATQILLKDCTQVVAIMGGHGMVRGTDPYVGVARITYELARAGHLILSGGGPGAMEASHLGAAFSRLSAADLKAGINRLAKQAELPKDAGQLVDNNGVIDPRIARELHAWLAPAVAIADQLGGAMPRSLGVPTWLYGYEPTTPFATHSAKYFQNSIREDGLVTMGVQGIVYAEGSAGTLQEIFQDAAQNFYQSFSPMVFLSSPADPSKHYWEIELPVRPLIEALLGGKPEYPTKVLFTDSIDETISFLLKQSRPPRTTCANAR